MSIELGRSPVRPSTEIERSAMADSSRLAQVVFGHDIHGDDALKLVGIQDRPVMIDSETNKRLRNKVDKFLMVIMWALFTIQVVNIMTLAFAASVGLQEGYSLQENMFLWLGRTFFLGYVGFLFVAIYFLQSLPLARYAGGCVIGLGISLICLPAVKDYTGILVIRVIMGVCAASISPAWILITSKWYKKEEQDLRTAIWFTGNGWAQFFGGVITYGIAHDAVTKGFSIKPWQIVFLVAGLLTIIFGIAFLIQVPDSPMNAWWFSAEDRRLAVERIRGNQQGIGTTMWKAYQFREALTDPITWLFFINAVAANIPSRSLTNLFDALVLVNGYQPAQSLLFRAIAGITAVISIIGWVFLARFVKSRLVAGMISILIGIVGVVVIDVLPQTNAKGRLAGYFISQLWIGQSAAVFSLVATNVAGWTKKIAVAVIFSIGYAVGNVIGYQTYVLSEAPTYKSAFISTFVCWGVCVVDLMVTFLWYIIQNKMKAARRDAEFYEKLANQEFLDFTDRENVEFVYTL